MLHYDRYTIKCLLVFTSWLHVPMQMLQNVCMDCLDRVDAQNNYRVHA